MLSGCHDIHDRIKDMDLEAVWAQLCFPTMGWMPYMLERIDYSWGRHRWYNDVNREVRPSELFRDHIFGCFISDNAGIYTRHLIGVDNLMFEGNYPHSDSDWPHTRKVLEEVMLEVPDDEARKMVELNARKLYKVPRTPASA